MSRVTFAEAAERVKGALDIVDVIQRHVILKKTGRNYTGKCPFHNDKNPSMNVSREKGVFKCFSCGVGGDTLSFVMRIENKTYGEVIRDFAQDQGLDIIYEGHNPEAVSIQRDAKQKILDLNQTTVRWFQERLDEPAAKLVVDYLVGRYPDAVMLSTALERFHIGYAPAGWENLTAHLKSSFEFVQASPDLLVTAGLSNSREHGQGHYDRFRHRLIIPIHDEKGQVVAFGGRALSDEEKPKYLNSPETAVYHKSQVLYGLYQAKETIRQNKAAVVMEGYFDVMTAHLAGITEAVGSCGTAMTDSHLKLLTRFGAETVYLAFDSDEAGLKAALSAITLIEPYMESANLQLKVLIVPGGKDPDEFIRMQGGMGGEVFRTLMQEARHYLNFKMDMALRGLSLNDSEGRIQAAARLTPMLAAISRPTMRAEYLKLYAEKIGLSEEALMLEVKRHEQASGRIHRADFGNFQNSDRKKAISKHASTSFKRNQPPMLTESIAVLRQGMTSRHVAAEKNLLRLALYSSESFSTMMSVLEKFQLSFSNPVHQQIVDGLRNFAGENTAQDADLPDKGFLGTLIDKMNHLYLNNPDVRDTFAEMVLTAESFGDSLDLGSLTGSALREKVLGLAEQQAGQLARCNKIQQLQTLKTHALKDAGNEIELTYQFHEQLEAASRAEP